MHIPADRELAGTLNPGRNGIAFDGESPGAVADALRGMLNTPLMVREELGAQSLRMAAEEFDPERVCREFFDLLRTL